MANIVNFKVYTWNGQEWEYVSRFPAAGEQEARELAKSLEFSEKKQVKILCETYESASQSFVERVIYSTNMHKVSPKKRKKKNQATVFGAVPKIIFVIGLALTVALFTSRFGTQMLSSTSVVSEEDMTRLAFGLFLFIFIVFSFWFGVRYIPKIISDENSDADRTEKDFADDAPLKFEGGKSPVRAKVEGNGFFDKIMVFIDSLANSIIPVKNTDDFEEKKSKNIAEIESLLQKKKKNEDNFVPPELSKASKDVFRIGDAETPAAEDNAESAEFLGEHRLDDLYAFQILVVQTATHNQDKIDAYQQFGIRLIISGALLHLASAKDFSEGEKMSAMQRLFEKMDVSAFMTEVFYEKLFDYSQDPQCQPMLEAGGELFSKFLKEPSSVEIPLNIQKIMSDWLMNGPDSQKEKIQESSFFVVMFTDIVGSTGMTQSLGDRSAQQVIHVHNTIVRQALAEYQGREVKMTGDGIMASFTSIANALDAAIGIQKAIQFYNSQKTSTPLQLRIGLNAGEPIVEGNDLFGTVVQIAARVCNLAEKNQIFVSHLVKELAVGKTYDFEDKGLQPLKGISQPQQVYEVIWNGK